MKKMINGVLVDMTEKEADALKKLQDIQKNSDTRSEFDKKLDILRDKRNALLLESSWTQLPDCPLDADKKKEWNRYRIALQNITNTIDENTDFTKIVFPEKP